MSECGCEIVTDIVDEQLNPGYVIEYCPLHAHAGELREALIEATHMIHSEFCGAFHHEFHKVFMPLLAKTSPGEK